MTRLRFRCTDVEFSLPRIRAPYDIELGVVASLTISVDDRQVYREVLFPVIELRLALARWLVSGSIEDFEFESMESDEIGLVWLRRQPSGGWRVGSVHQDRPEVAELTLSDVASAVQQLSDLVDGWVADNLGLSVTSLFGIASSHRPIA